MIRTHAYLHKKLYQRIQLKAEQDNLPAAQVVRELLEKGLQTSQTETAGQALLRLIKIGAAGPSDLSTNLDDYLYGDRD